MTFWKKYEWLARNWFLKTVIPFFVVSGIFLLVTPASWYPDWFYPRLTGVGAFLYALFILAPNFVFLINHDSDPNILNVKHRSITRLQDYIAVGSLLGFTGTLGLYQFNFPFDKLNHLIVPFLSTIALSRFIYRWWDITFSRALGITILIVLGCTAIGWETLEYLSDLFFGTVAFGIHGQKIFFDTVFDISLDITGILLGAIAVTLRKSPFPY